jgi:SAM-dependent methyltransferase
MFTYRDLIGSLRESYDGSAADRDGFTKQPWKLTERITFASRLAEAGAQRLLEIGAGTGQDSVYFMGKGLAVTAIDLSPEMVARSRAKGVDAHVMDFLSIDFPPNSFDAVWAFNCLLHVPNTDLPGVLAKIRPVLRPGGLFFIGVYGGEEFEGILERDNNVPKRFFSLRTDEQLQRFATDAGFRVVDFRAIESKDPRWQALTLSL